MFSFHSNAVIVTVLLIFLVGGIRSFKDSEGGRSFLIDAECDCFLKDGRPFRYVSGSLHYFRVPRAYWKDRMIKMKAAGLNAIQTYVEWSGHQPEPDQLNFEDNYDLISFLKTAVETDMLVILRPGPYICAERDFGGFPYWLYRVNPKMKLRTSDPVYLRYVDQWFGILLPMVKPFLYENGGPIIWVQVENEYGQIGVCDYEYMVHLRELTRRHLGSSVPLFRTDIPRAEFYACDNVDDVYVTADFGAGEDVQAAFNNIRLIREHGPLVVTEYYTGWMDNWGKPHANVSIDEICATLDLVLASNGSVNFYMFHGGTNFGFGNGANMPYAPQPTSYDYNAPLSEAGDPTTNYFRIRDVIGKYMPLPPGPVPGPSPKLELGPLHLSLVMSLARSIPYLGYAKMSYSVYPKTFEELGQAYGFVSYSTLIDFIPPDPAILSAPGLRDRGYVFVDKEFRGVVSREKSIFEMPLAIYQTQVLTIVVENSGRVNSGQTGQKGFVSNVTLGTRTLKNWVNMPLDLSLMNTMLLQQQQRTSMVHDQFSNVPGFYSVNFTLPEGQIPLDTFLDPTGWRRGVAFLNGFNLGRYWPVTGPQVTLYVPGTLLKPYPNTNTLTLMELERPPCSPENKRPNAVACSVSFVAQPILDGPVP